MSLLLDAICIAWQNGNDLKTVQKIIYKIVNRAKITYMWYDVESYTIANCQLRSVARSHLFTFKKIILTFIYSNITVKDWDQESLQCQWLYNDDDPKMEGKVLHQNSQVTLQIFYCRLHSQIEHQLIHLENTTLGLYT